MKHKINYKVLLAFFIITILLVGKFFTPYNPNMVDMKVRLQPPSFEHILGTDNLGRDVFSRILTGAWTTVGTTIVILGFSVILGTLIGLFSGYCGGKIDWLLMRVVDGFIAFPDYIVAIVLSAILGAGTFNLILAIVFVKWVKYARLVRSIVLNVKNQDYIIMARLNGMSTFSILIKHILPHILENIITISAVDMGKIILMISSLSYIGLGIQPPNAEWGSMLNEGRGFFQYASHLMIAPGMAIFIIVAIINFLGDEIKKHYTVKY